MLFLADGFIIYYWQYHIWVKIFKNGQSKICERQPLNIWSDIVCCLGKAVFHKFYLVHSWIPCSFKGEFSIVLNKPVYCVGFQWLLDSSTTFPLLAWQVGLPRKRPIFAKTIHSLFNQSDRLYLFLLMIT